MWDVTLVHEKAAGLVHTSSGGGGGGKNTHPHTYPITQANPVEDHRFEELLFSERLIAAASGNLSQALTPL